MAEIGTLTERSFPNCLQALRQHHRLQFLIIHKHFSTDFLQRIRERYLAEIGTLTERSFPYRQQALRQHHRLQLLELFEHISADTRHLVLDIVQRVCARHHEVGLQLAGICFIEPCRFILI